MTIKPVTRATKRFADLEGITQEFSEDYEVSGFEIRFLPANDYRGESYYAVGYSEPLGDVEICSECGNSWLCIAGNVYDEEYCTNCGGPR